ncbi:hypothetical protein FACS189493_2240 [Spirochaetia bacterium]|nr:hypothetical protein FACS189493_2240 [Spirochaetia bacterium]
MYSVGIAYLLWLVSGCGALGFHRFYLGKIPTGVLWMCTGGLGMVGAIYDFFTLPRQVREGNMRNALLNGFGPRSQNYRYVDDGNARATGNKETNERVILRIAKHNKGIITATELALEAGIPIDAAKKDLEAMVTKGFAEMRVRKSGALVYTIPELMDSDSPLEEW